MRRAFLPTHLPLLELMRPMKVLHMNADELLLLRLSAAPTLANKIRHYADPEFTGLFDAQA